MRHIQAPEEFTGDEPSVFLAGGISGCIDWHAWFVELMKTSNLVLLNPRQKHFPIGDPGAAERQIAWEFRHLRRARAHLFWFAPETLCPIALFELGVWSTKAALLFVGTHPEYQRRLDVQIQLQLARPEVQVVDSVEALAEQVLAAEHELTEGKRP